jgi:hypothetical protein
VLDRTQPQRDGLVEVVADVSFARDVFNEGSEPMLDNVRIVTRQLAES